MSIYSVGSSLVDSVGSGHDWSVWCLGNTEILGSKTPIIVRRFRLNVCVDRGQLLQKTIEIKP